MFQTWKNDIFFHKKRFDLFVPKPFCKIEEMENVLLTQSRSKNFLFVLNNIRYHFFFLSFDKMPQMYKWSNEHDLVVKHKRHATSNNLVGFLVFRKTRCMFSNVRFSITFSLTKKLNFMLMKVLNENGVFNPKERCLHFVSLP